MKSREAKRSQSRRLIARAYQYAQLASSRLGDERGLARMRGLACVESAKHIKRLPLDTELGAMVALFPDNVRLVNRLENIRKGKEAK